MKRPEDMANVVVYLAGDDAAYIAGRRRSDVGDCRILDALTDRMPPFAILTGCGRVAPAPSSSEPGGSHMTDKERPRDAAPSQDTAQGSKRTTIPASVVGVTLTISDKALEKLDRIQEETIKAAQEGQKFSWR